MRKRRPTLRKKSVHGLERLAPPTLPPMSRALISIVVLLAIAPASNAAAPDPLAVAFGTMPGLWDVRISPNGTKVSFLQMHPEDLSILRIYDLTTGEANLALASTRDGFNLQWCDWANDERLLCSFFGISKAEGRFFVTRLVAVNADGSGLKQFTKTPEVDERVPRTAPNGRLFTYNYGNYLVDGAVALRALNRNMDWNLPEDEASTLNGMLLEELGEIPSGKASLKIGSHIITILEIKDNVICKVLIKPERAPE